ncbi:flavin-binding monooxygenase [Grosmannia clavigera kw1407]|uniref:Flavin-binding monooxygenase n=1 Tax=Grosmannia clavigera (strain kw1407 / UAMH 11150) TaxID=655863 RepID=F0X9R4_GROCL|nr:flavin-binding monooxygenase [Grosmannia clavigera kw1407]EFX06152.1 flavin-binding monooxygenase [Grosmannia clavigera kw1407]
MSIPTNSSPAEANGFHISPAPAEKTTYQIKEEPMRKPRKIKVIAIGAGASALCFGHEVNNSDLDIEFVAYDKNPVIGGTWYENRYPGCACDIPSVCYQFSWAPSPDWTTYYSGSREIHQYFLNVAKEFDLLKYCHVNRLVTGCYWQEESQTWRVRVQKLDKPDEFFEDECNVLLNATGVLNANWDQSVDFKDKTIAVIGAGSSGIQIIPALQPIVKNLKAFVRSTTWVTAGFGQRFAGPNGANFKYSDEQKEVMRTDPKKYLTYRKFVESELNGRFRLILNGTKEQEEAREFAIKEMTRKSAKKPEVAEQLIPKGYEIGCRRPTPGNGFIEALCEDNVDFIRGGVKKITEDGLISDDGTEHKVDIIVCATGFDVTWKPRYPTIGRGGRSLSEEWKDASRTYLSMSVPHFPNYLIFNGPFGVYGHGSILPVMEKISKHYMQMIQKMSDEWITAFEPTEEATEDFAEHRRAFIPRTAWSGSCNSWFKQGSVKGEVMMWPGSRVHFFDALETPRWEDYRLTRANHNRFYYFGNGRAEREFDGHDLSWYLGLLDGVDKQPIYREEDVSEFLAR